MQESWPALRGPGLCKEALMWCDRRSCLSAFPWQRAAKSNANSQAARRAFCLIQFPPLLSQHTTTWKEPLFHIPLGLIALFSTWCISCQLFILHMAVTLSGRPFNQDYFHRTLRGQWEANLYHCTQVGMEELRLHWDLGVGYYTCVWSLGGEHCCLTARESRFKSWLRSLFCLWSLHVMLVYKSFRHHLNLLWVWAWGWGHTRTGKVKFSYGGMQVALEILCT